MSFGLIARDFEGGLIEAKYVFISNPVSPAMIEAMAIKKALCLCENYHDRL